MKINTHFIVKYRLWLLIAFFSFTIAFAFFMTNLRIDSSLTLVLPKDDPVYQSNQQIEDMFGGYEEIAIMVKKKDNQAQNSLLDSISLKVMQQCSDLLKSYPEINNDQIISLPDLIYSAKLGQGQIIEKEKFIEKLTSNEIYSFSELESIKGKIISLDKTTALITGPTSQNLGNTDLKLKIFASSLRKKIKELNEKFPDYKLLLSGQPIVKTDIMAYMTSDLYKLFPLAIFIVILILYFILGSFQLTLVPILVTLFSITWTFSLKGLLNSPLTITETAIPIILISIGCADGIHILLEFTHLLTKGFGLKKAIDEAIANLKRPVILTTVTTSCGFLSLMTGSGTSLKNTGFYLAVGVIVALIFSLIFIPVWLSTFSTKTLIKRKKNKKKELSQLPMKWIDSFYFYLYKFRWLSITILIGMTYLSIMSLINIKTDTDEIRYFKESASIRQIAEEIEKEMGGFNTLYLVLRPNFQSNSQEKMVSKDFFKKLIEIEKKMESIEEVNYHFSLLTWYKRFLTNQGLSLSQILKGSEDKIDSDIKQLLASKDVNSQIKKTVNDELTHFNFVIKMKHANTSYMQKVMDSLTPDLEKHPELFDFQFGGDAIRLHNGRVIIKNQVRSLLTSIIFIFILSALFFKSLRIGLFITIPTTIAILINFIVMWLFGISLNPATAIIASVSMGVGVDYAIHFISKFQLEWKKSNGTQSVLFVIGQTAKHTMSPILSNASAVGIGFLSLLFSSYQIIMDMGWIIALSMFFTAFSSLTIVPLFLAMYYTNKENSQIK